MQPLLRYWMMALAAIGAVVSGLTSLVVSLFTRSKVIQGAANPSFSDAPGVQAPAAAAIYPFNHFKTVFMKASFRRISMATFVVLLSLITTVVNAQYRANVGNATVTTDKPDYAPRSNAVFTGKGFLPGDSVRLKVRNLTRACNTIDHTDSSYQGWTVIADASGSFVTNWTVCDCAGDSLRLRAVGVTSHDTAYAYFSDAPKVGSVVLTTGQSPDPVTAGGVASYGIKIDRGTGSGSSGTIAISLSFTGLPAGVSFSTTSSLNFTSSDNTKSSTLQLQTSSSTPAGTYPFTLRAETSTSDFATTTGTLIVASGCTAPTSISATNSCQNGSIVTFTQSGGTTGGTWSVSGGGTINATTGDFTPTTPGCFTTTYTISTCSSTTSFVVFPSAPSAPTVNSGSAAISVTPPPTIGGFTIQYSFDDGATWGANIPPTADNCSGYKIRTRYVTSTSCGSTAANTNSECSVSNATTRKVDLTAPSLTGTLPGGAQGSVCKSAAPAAPSESSIAALYTDNCSSVTATLLTSSVTGTDKSWTATYTYSIKDASDNAASNAVVTYTGGDVTAPLTPTLTKVTGECSVTVSVPTTTDNCAATVLGTTNDPLIYTAQGSYTVHWTFSDGNGNSTTANQSVEVKDVTSPVLTAARNQDVNMDATSGCTITIPNVKGTATDNCSVTITQSPAVGAQVATSHNGTVNVTVTATDAGGNTDVKTVVLTAKDITAPSLTVPAISAQPFNPSKCGAEVAVTAPTATDNCGIVKQTWTITRNNVVEASSALTGINNVGTYIFGIGTSNIEYTVTDGAGLTNKQSTTVVVNPLSVTPVLTVVALDDNNNEVTTTATCTQQYSDRIKLQVVIPGGASTCQANANAAGSATFNLSNNSKTQEMGSANFETDGKGNLVATLITKLVESPSTLGIMAPGLKNISIVINNPNTQIYNVGSSISKQLAITQEDANPILYNGPTVFGAQLQGKNYTATVSLSALVYDKADGNSGNITNGKVMFNFNGQNYPNNEIGLINPGDTTVGQALVNGISVPLTTSEASAGGKVIELKTSLGNVNTSAVGYYTGSTETPDIITIALSGADFVTGGGYIKLPSTTSGSFPGSVGSKANFGMTMKWNKSGANLQGNVNIIYRGAGGRIFQIKSNAINSLVTADVVDGRQGTINTKAEFRELDVNGNILWYSGNMDLTVVAFESSVDKTGKSDRISFRLVNPSTKAASNSSIILPAGVLFTNELNGANTVTTQLSGGKIQVRSATTVAPTRIAEPVTKVEIQLAAPFAIKAYPNPTSDVFNLQVSSENLKENVQLRVVDLFGRVIEQKNNVAPNTTLQLGHNYKNGMYIVELIQGSNRKQLKLVKQ